MDGVEGNVVDSVDVLVTLVDSVRSVTLEREVVLWVLCVHVLDGHPTLHASQGKSSGLRLLVPKDRDAPVLVLEWGLNALELLGLPLQGVDDYPTSRRPDHGHGIVHISTVASLAKVNAHNRGWRPKKRDEKEIMLP